MAEPSVGICGFSSAEIALWPSEGKVLIRRDNCQFMQKPLRLVFLAERYPQRNNHVSRRTKTLWTCSAFVQKLMTEFFTAKKKTKCAFRKITCATEGGDLHKEGTTLVGGGPSKTNVSKCEEKRFLRN